MTSKSKHNNTLSKDDKSSDDVWTLALCTRCKHYFEDCGFILDQTKWCGEKEVCEHCEVSKGWEYGVYCAGGRVPL